jgi:hypothetical protein
MKNNTTQRYWQHKTQNKDKQNTTQTPATQDTERRTNKTQHRHWKHRTHKTQNEDKQNTTQRHWQHRTHKTQNEEHTKHNTETLPTQDTPDTE